MISPIPRPVEEILPWNEQTRTRFPRHVVARLTELILAFDETYEEREDYSIGYRHLYGSLESSDGFPLTTVHFWIASHDSDRILLWLPGSQVWIKPTSHYLYFDPIDPSLLPGSVDYATVWVVYDDSEGSSFFGIAEITLVAPEQVPPHTWHLGLNIH
jgi:hypothetical protein